MSEISKNEKGIYVIGDEKNLKINDDYYGEYIDLYDENRSLTGEKYLEKKEIRLKCQSGNILLWSWCL